ncbi:dachshund homolog 2 isoform X2 [Planococcus citri]|uniref:dachshund homolog 2 isoform X2 n=1 Tax=Planococcus citri TaxID=170843 RepID=UPI0031F8EF1C
MIMESTMDSSASTASDRSSNMSCSPTPPKVAITPPSVGGQSSPGMTSSTAGRMSQNSPIVSAHQLNSPPHVSTPTSLGHRLTAPHGMPPLPSLGLLSSLSNMVHHSPMDLMSVSHHHSAPPRSYNSPPPISTSDPTANECKLVDYRGQKVAAFIIQGDTMLCLPQAFELFLKHLVGGLHTVYTKLKRLDIVPLVCNVEQVRILRGLGAIQPGVNRCKLLSCKDFDVLYRDCTTARCMMSHKATDGNALLFRSSRPGRPPKRATSVGLSIAANHLNQLKKHRENGDYIGSYENGHVNDGHLKLEKSPLLANGYNHPPTHLNHMQQFMQFNHAAAAALLNHSGLPPPHPALSRPPHDPSSLLKGPLPPAAVDALRSGLWENCRAYEDIVKQIERIREERHDVERVLSLENKPRDLSSSHNGSSEGHSPVLNLSKGGGDHSESEADQIAAGHDDVDDEVDSVSDAEDNDDDKDQDLSDGGDMAGGNSSIPGSDSSPRSGALNYSSALNASSNSTANFNQNSASIESLFSNIREILKVAADSAIQKERQINYEKAEMRVELLKEREIKESLNRELSHEQKKRVDFQKRYKKEKATRRRLQDQLDHEMKRRNQLEEAIKSTTSNTEVLRLLNEYVTYDRERDKEKEKEKSERVPTTSEQLQAVSEAISSGVFNGSGGGSASSGSSGASQHQSSSTDTPNEKSWNYSALDLISSTGAAFWTNYPELAQELELKARQQAAQQNAQQVGAAHSDRSGSKSPIQDSTRSASYYKNSVLFSTAT